MNLNGSIGEITIIGTGGGYGESIVVHIGNNNWIIVDSCVNPNTKVCLPLSYLNNLGVDVANNVQLIICTHWHDDHIQGISEILKICSNAKFCFAQANDRKKFLQFVRLDYQKLNVEASNSSTIEFNNCIEILEKRGQSIVLATCNKSLLSFSLTDNIRTEVFSLSPSDFTILEFDKEISKLITEFGSPAKKVISKSPNSKSVVIFLKVGEHRAILGADLEVSSDKREGWDSIILNDTVIDKKSTLFKIPHHGSQNGYHSKVWTDLIDINPVAGLTPWNKNEKLPEAEMLERYFSHTEQLYITSLVFSEKPKKRNKRIEKMIKNLKFKIREVKFEEGIIRCRINLLDKQSKWEVDALKNAHKIDKNYFG